MHEMLIALSRETYIRPHRHAGKSESVHVIAGSGDLALFDDGGNLCDVVELGPFGAGKCFYYRMAAPQYHMLIVRSDILVVHETTNGPFRPHDTDFATWAPEEEDIEGRAVFLTRVETQIISRRRLSEELP